MQIVIATLLLLFTSDNVFVQKLTWIVDRNQISVSFQICRVLVSYMCGSFGGITGTVIWDEKDVTKSHVEVTILTASVPTNNAARDADLKSISY